MLNRRLRNAVLAGICLFLFVTATAIADLVVFQETVSKRIETELEELDEPLRSDLIEVLDDLYVDTWDGTNGLEGDLLTFYVEDVARDVRSVKAAWESGSKLTDYPEDVKLFIPDYRKGAQRIPSTLTMEEFQTLYNTCVDEFHNILDEQIHKKFEFQDTIRVSAAACLKLDKTTLPKSVLEYTEALPDSVETQNDLFSAILKSVIQRKSKESRERLNLNINPEENRVEFHKLLFFYANDCQKRTNEKEVSRILDALSKEKPDTFETIHGWDSDVKNIYWYATTNWLSSTEKNPSYSRRVGTNTACASFTYTKPTGSADTPTSDTK